MGNVLWVFGDSFCAYNDNWIKHIQTEGGFSEVRISGLAGSSLTYTLEKIYLNLNNIKKSDGVVVGMTDHARQYLSSFHLRPRSGINSNRIFTKHPREVDTLGEVDKVYSDYLKYLYDDFQTLQHLIPTYHFVKNYIPEVLKTKKYVSFYTMSSNLILSCAETPNSERYINFLPVYKKLHPFSGYPGMFEVVKEFAKLHKLPSSSYEGTTNHWIDHPSYEEYFWNIYTKLFKPLWLN